MIPVLSRCSINFRRNANQLYIKNISRTFSTSFHSTRQNFAPHHTQKYKKTGSQPTPKQSTQKANSKGPGIIYADSAEVLNPFVNKTSSSPSPLTTMTNKPSKPKVYKNSAEFEQEQLLNESATAGTSGKPQKNQHQALSTLDALQKIRFHPIYRLTRGFALTSIIYFLVVRVRDATSTPSELYDENAPWDEILMKWAIKAQRVLWYTLKRVWSPFKTDEEVAREIILKKRKEFLSQPQIPLNIELEPVFIDRNDNEFLD